ncbi:efflux RND transporter permease subunit, partial [Salmonella enterica]|uniref:efflux RND transporter permease subunit n=1 Tax=Salmonella enterica TaxID=28901 RepID=UPI003FA7C303
GVHVSELDVGLKPTAELTRSMDAIRADIRSRLANLPASLEIGQPISHRIDHMLSGVRSQIAIKIFGEDLDALRGQADALRARFPGRARQLAESAGTGLRELMASDGDLDEALSICNRGLLASMEVSRDAFAATGRRVIQQVVEPLAETFQA